MLSWDNQSLLKYNYINVCYEILMKDTFNWNPFSGYQSLVDTEPIIFSNTRYLRDFKLINKIIIDNWILSCGNNGFFLCYLSTMGFLYSADWYQRRFYTHPTWPLTFSCPLGILAVHQGQKIGFCFRHLCLVNNLKFMETLSKKF